MAFMEVFSLMRVESNVALLNIGPGKVAARVELFPGMRMPNLWPVKALSLVLDTVTAYMQMYLANIVHQATPPVAAENSRPDVNPAGRV
jgi:hypothetical protein